MLVYYVLFCILFFLMCIPMLQVVGSKIYLYKITTLISLFVLVFFAGLRGEGVDRDYLNYVAWWEQIHSGLEWSYFIKDPGLSFIFLVFSFFDLPVSAVFLFVSAVSLTVKYKFYKNITPELLGVAFFISFSRFYIVHDMTQIRVGIAIPLASIAVYYFFAKNKILGAVLLASAVLFHVSTVVFIPIVLFFIFRQFVFSRAIVCVFLFVGFLFKFFHASLFNFLNSLIPFRFLDYLDGSYEVSEVSLFSIYFILRISVLSFLMLFFWFKIRPWDRVTLILVSFGLAFQVAFSWNDAISLRSAELFGMFDVLMFLMPIQFFRGYARYCYSLLLFFMAVYFYWSSILIIMPYKTIF